MFKGNSAQLQDHDIYQQGYPAQPHPFRTNAVHFTNKQWIMDLRASWHVLPFKELFFNLVLGDQSTVALADNTTFKVSGRGEIPVQFSTEDGPIQGSLRDVLYVPEFK